MRRFHKTAVVLAAATLSIGAAGSAFAAAGGAENITSLPASKKDIAVTGTYEQGTASDTVYKVDIEWGAMAFTYKAAAKGSWNTATHKYDNAETAGKWTPAVADGNRITVTNHSNAGVTAELSFAADSSISGLMGIFQVSDSDKTDKSTLSLETADNGKGTDGAGMETSDSAYLVLSGGELGSDTAAGTKIGTVTVTIDKAVTP